MTLQLKKIAKKNFASHIVTCNKQEQQSYIQTLETYAI